MSKNVKNVIAISIIFLILVPNSSVKATSIKENNILLIHYGLDQNGTPVGVRITQNMINLIISASTE